MMDLLVFGMGYSSNASVAALQKMTSDGLSVVGTNRDTRGVFDDDNWTGMVWPNADDGALRNHIADATHCLHSIAPGEAGDPVLNAFEPDLIGAKRLEWMCYFSTVGVYGNHDGAWIDESAPTHPLNVRSQWRIEAEKAWQAFAARKGIPLLILRLAGIYGPGRSSFDKLKAGTARRIIKPGQVFNRIHVADIGRVTALAAQQKLAGTFNLCDDLPAPPQDLVAHAAGMAGMAPPPEMDFADADMTPMARSFYNDNKRISNAAIKKALGIEMLYPTYRQGLASIYAAD